jgi:hypothetical protein
MNRGSFIHLLKLGVCIFLAPFVVDFAHGSDAPVRADYLRTTHGKAPLRWHSFRLTLVNKRDTPVWFILPSYGDQSLPEKGNFSAKSSMDQPFGGKLYAAAGGLAIEVSIYGQDGFRAFQIPAKGKLVFVDYNISGWKDFREFEVIEALEMKVNGTTPLAKWLPYRTLSGGNVIVDKKYMYPNNLDFDEVKNKSREDYPKETVNDIKAEGLRRFKIAFEPKDANR